jgi:hypothetical protein
MIGATLWALCRLVVAPAAVWAWVALVAGAAAGVTWGTARALWQRWRRTCGFEALGRLHVEVDRFNALVSAVDVAQQLLRSRTVPPAELDALARAHQELAHALAVERLLRENRAVLDAVGRPLELALSPMEALRTEESADESTTLVHETLAVATRVREELESMRTRSHRG